MGDQKIGNILNLAMDATDAERDKSQNLSVGYQPEERQWEVIVKYSGDVEGLTGNRISVVPLLAGYAIVKLPESYLSEFSRRPQVEFIEKPVRLYFQLLQGTLASCIRPLQSDIDGLSGKGILIGIVDSGVDIWHRDFRKKDGSTRILKIWDQTIPGNPPKGYIRGTEYTQEKINEALALPKGEGKRLVPSEDVSGHGTAVLGIAAGNGQESSGMNRGVAYDSDLLVVKMGVSEKDSFPRTTEMMQGVDYLVRQALEMGKPLVINLSFGNNYGSHLGDSLLETYLDAVSGIGRTAICVGSGNNGNDALHAGGRLSQGEVQEIEFGVGPYEKNLNLQLWKAYEDDVEISLENPSGMWMGPFREKMGAQRYRAGNTELLIYYGQPAPYHVTQEIYMDFLTVGEEADSRIDSGVWKVILKGRKIKEGTYSMWLPGGGVLNRTTAFLMPRAEGTLTIPSAARKVITVGAYDSNLNAYADFSGRGSRYLNVIKPDLAAPGVNIMAPRAGGGYASFTGTSFAAPFVTGAGALLMEWGIVRENDPYLYGEKLKAYLRRGARSLPGYTEYPNEEVGWGTLCVRESI